MSETVNLAFVAGIMGVLGGLASLPFNFIGTYFLKRFEQNHQHRHNLIEKGRELALTHRYQMVAGMNLEEELNQIKTKISSIETDVMHLKASG